MIHLTCNITKLYYSARKYDSCIIGWSCKHDFRNRLRDTNFLFQNGKKPISLKGNFSRTTATSSVPNHCCWNVDDNDMIMVIYWNSPRIHRRPTSWGFLVQFFLFPDGPTNGRIMACSCSSAHWGCAGIGRPLHPYRGKDLMKDSVKSSVNSRVM